jgi:hypothetical protein
MPTRSSDGFQDNPTVSVGSSPDRVAPGYLPCDKAPEPVGLDASGLVPPAVTATRHIGAGSP